MTQLGETKITMRFKMDKSTDPLEYLRRLMDLSPEEMTALQARMRAVAEDVSLDPPNDVQRLMDWTAGYAAAQEDALARYRALYSLPKPGETDEQ